MSPVRICSVPNCHRALKAKGYCTGHYAQVRRHGSVTPLPLGPSYNDAGRPKVETPTYNGMHRRLRAIRGKAREHGCSVADCDRQGDQWAYAHADPNELTSTELWNGVPREIAYSLDPDSYVALCRGHHVALDRYGLVV